MTGRLATIKRRAKREGWSSWITSEADERMLLEGYVWDRAKAERVWKFFPAFLRHFKGRWAGQPFDLLDWQTDVLGHTFGWVHEETRLRRYVRVRIWCGKKNGKSEIAAGIGLYMVVGDGEPGAEVYTTATSRGQASIVHGAAVSMVKASPALKRRLRIHKTSSVIYDEGTQSKYQALAADGGTVEGINPHATIKDELHVWKDRQFLDALEYASGTRDQPLDLVISTAGVDDRTSIGYQEYEHNKHILEGVAQDDRCFVRIWEATEVEDDDLDNPEHHEAANPSYGVTIDPEAMIEEARRAMDRPSLRPAFRRYKLNQWTGELDAFVRLEKWDAVDEGVNPVEWRREKLAEHEGAECFGGLDLGSNSDLTALLLQFSRGDGDGVDWLPFFWIPEDAVDDRETEHRVPYRIWIEQGFIRTTPGEVTNYNAIQADVDRIAEDYGLRCLAVDRAFQGDQLITNLDDMGLPVVAFGMGYMSMAAPMKEFERRYLGEEIHHGANPVLRWMASSMAVSQDPAGNLKPNKLRSRGKIDGIVAGVSALAVSISDEDETADVGVTVL